MNLYHRVMIAIDSQNYYCSAINLYKNSKVDYKKLYNKIVNHKLRGIPRKVTKAIAYTVTSEEVDQSNFKKFLNGLGIEVKEKLARRNGNHLYKTNWDTEMIVDIIKFRDMYDIIALCSGDGDFVPLVKLLKEEFRKFVEVYAFENSYSEDLKKEATKFWFIRKKHLFLPKETKEV